MKELTPYILILISQQMDKSAATRGISTPLDRFTLLKSYSLDSRPLSAAGTVI